MPKCSSILNCTGVERLFAPPGAPGIRIEELNRLSPDFKERGRYQHLHFVDNDRIYHHLLDLNMVLGRAGLIFPGGEVFPNGKINSWYTVAELRELCAEYRNSDETEWEEMARTPEVDDFEALYHDERERRELAISKKGVNGPFFSIMR